MINLKKKLKNEKELKGIKTTSFQELGYMKLLSKIAGHIFIFYFDIISFYKESRK